MINKLTPDLIKKAVAELTTRDADLARIVSAYGIPPFHQRDQGFPTLVYIILEQQVSLSSARATYNKLIDLGPDLTPELFLKQDDLALRAIGFSRQKTRYTQHLAQSIVDGELDLDALPGLDDDDTRTALTRIKGIGDWTATIYQMTALRHPDVWPHGDRAIAVAVQQVKGLTTPPGQESLKDIGDGYRPWRSVAARLFWHHYLGGEIPA
ncbi:uncharacterized protein METZ01_LOCUS148575 [marine metagenome]|uniref:HhH-GPD domain-containing protein n=1 Tax=marine metagenome TaxID=408172 RepID=A0A382A3B9_9ZZZZ